MSIYTPQQLLEQINEAYFEEVFKSELPQKERTAKMKLAQQKLRVAKRNLKAEQTLIKQRWDNRNKGEAAKEQLELAPYLLIESYLGKVEISYSELEAAIAGGSNYPEAITLGEVIIGDEWVGDYVIGGRIAAEEWYQGKVQELKDKLRQAQKEAFADAKKYIEMKRYDLARSLLESMPSVPLAQEWLQKLQKLEDKEGQIKKRNTIIIEAISAGVLAIFIILAILARISK